MNFKQRLIIGAVVLASLFYLGINREYSKKDLTNDEIKSIISKVEQSFMSAEQKILGTKPIVPDDNPLGPDPDPEKCVCKGTGKIIQGDGHVSPCPYHSVKESKNLCSCGCGKEGCQCQSCTREVTRTRRLLFPLFR